MKSVLQETDDIDFYHESPLELPKFDEIGAFICRMKGSHKRLLGYWNGGRIFVEVVGHVEMWFHDDSFFGKVKLMVGDREVEAYCIGSIWCTGTGVLITRSEQWFLYGPERAVDKQWKGLGDLRGAVLNFTRGNHINITLTNEIKVIEVLEEM